MLFQDIPAYLEAADEHAREAFARARTEPHEAAAFALSSIAQSLAVIAKAASDAH